MPKRTVRIVIETERLTVVTPLPPNAFRAAERDDRLRSYMRGICARDPEAMASLYDETCRIVYSLALRVLNRPADAEEVTLDVYQQVWNSSDSFDLSRGEVMSWLTVLARSRSIDRLRRARCRQGRETSMEYIAEQPCPSQAPDVASIYGEERALVRRALHQLVPEQRELIELAFFGGLTHVEIAESLKLPLGTIKTRIRAGMQKLRSILSPLQSGAGTLAQCHLVFSFTEREARLPAPELSWIRAFLSFG
jgi:RNA polymerase sigma-70 factor (ECF subfamily)